MPIERAAPDHKSTLSRCFEITSIIHGQPLADRYSFHSTKGLVLRVDLGVQFEVLEDTSTDRDMQRTFISQLVQPYPSFVSLTRFRRALHPVK